MRLLLIEDDRRLEAALRRALERAGFAVDAARTVEEADVQAAAHDYELMVVDRRLPDGDGLEVCRRARERGRTGGILVLTAMDDRASTIHGLDAGADDYLGKPVDLDVLIARLRALGRRQAARPVRPASFGTLTLSLERRSVEISGRPIALTGREFAILELFVSQPRTVVSRSQIVEYAWGEREEPWSNTVDVLIGRIRRKLARIPDAPKIVTYRGSGYALE
jgi:DNA-binding response OmpR family regulator